MRIHQQSIKWLSKHIYYGQFVSNFPATWNMEHGIRLAVNLFLTNKSKSVLVLIFSIFKDSGHALGLYWDFGHRLVISSTRSNN